MKRSQWGAVAISCAVLVAVGTSGGSEEDPDPLAMGTVLKRAELASAKGMEGILVLRDLPPGGESGRHTQGGDELVYILEGSVILEVEGQDPVTLKAGQAFHTSKGQVHNVKNASAEKGGKALAFYIAKKGAKLEGLSTPAE